MSDWKDYSTVGYGLWYNRTEGLLWEEHCYPQLLWEFSNTLDSSLLRSLAIQQSGNPSSLSQGPSHRHWYLVASPTCWLVFAAPPSGCQMVTFALELYLNVPVKVDVLLSLIWSSNITDWGFIVTTNTEISESFFTEFELYHFSPFLFLSHFFYVNVCFLLFFHTCHWVLLMNRPYHIIFYSGTRNILFDALVVISW